MTNERQKDAAKRVIRLRPEARPARYSQLDSQQKKAFDHIVGLIGEAIGDIDAAVSDARMPSWVELRKASRTAFLDGDRGMGKTTVSLSLIYASSVSDDRDYPKELHDTLRAMRERAVWLEPIGMDRFPVGANLLAAFLARIDQAVRRQIQVCGEGINAAGDCTDGGALGRVPYYEKALLRLQHLQTAVAVAWDGNLPARGGQLDPDSYAVEVANAERARLSLQPDLSQALDDLACYLYRFSASVRNPLFVLPVDDVDLDPLRCLDVLQLLRLIAVPRLFTLVLGNLGLVETVLNLKCSSELATAYESRFREMLSVEAAEVARSAGEVAANIMRKLIPPAQRIVLDRLSVLEALNYVPLVPDAKGLPRLHNLLADCPLELPVLKRERDPLQSLRAFLLCAAAVVLDEEGKVTEADVNRSHYAAIQILNAPPRRIADWWFDLQRLVGRVARIREGDRSESEKHEIHRAIVHAVGLICQRAIREDRLLTKKQRDDYRQALRINPAGIWELTEVVNSIPEIDRAYTLFGLRDPLAKHPWHTLRLTPRVVINYGRGWYLRPATARILSPPVIVDMEKEPDYLFNSAIALGRFDPDSTYALMLLHDLLALGPEWEGMKQSVQINRPHERWAATVWGAGAGDWGWVSWPAPLCSSYWQFDRFVEYWKRAVDECKDLVMENTVEDTLLPLVYGWINAGQAVWRDEALERVSLSGITTAAKQRGLWKQLAGKVGKLVDPDRERFEAAMLRQWIWRLGYFLSPAVSGVTLPIAKCFAEVDDLRAAWVGGRDMIRSSHQDIIDFCVRHGMRDFAGELLPAVEAYAMEMFGAKLGLQMPKQRSNIANAQ